MSYPKYEVSVEQVNTYACIHSSVEVSGSSGPRDTDVLFSHQKGRYTCKRSEILISVTMTNWMKRQLSIGSKRASHFCVFLIGDADNNVVYKQRLG